MSDSHSALPPETIVKVLNIHLESRLDRFRSISSSVDLEATSIQLPLLTGYLLTISLDEDFDWEPEFSNQSRSNQMWFYSLSTLGQLCVNGDPHSLEFKWATILLQSFLKASESEAFLNKLKSIPSADHSGATRVNALIAYLQVFKLSPEPDVSFAAEIIESLQYWANWLAEDEQFSLNNHGVMVAMALLQSSYLLSEVASSNDYYEVAEQRILKIARYAFDEDGMCNENTIGYHNFNMRLYEQIVRFLKINYSESNLLNVLESVLAKAEAALALSIRQDKSIPPIGDSPEYRVTTTPIEKSASFPQSGFSVVKKAGLYLSFVCGSRTEIHKHHDDTSITLNYEGRDILIDGGSYNYDRLDPFRRCIQSSYGHSGFFPEVHEGMPRREIIKQQGGHRNHTVDFLDAVSISGLAGVVESPDRNLKGCREVYVIGPKEIVVLDSGWHASTASSHGWVSRFLFPHEQKVTHLTDNKFTFTDGVVGGTLIQLMDSTTEIYRGHDELPYRGWHARKNGIIEKATSLEFRSVNSIARFITLIKIGNEQAEIGDFSEEALKIAAGVIKPFGGLLRNGDSGA